MVSTRSVREKVFLMVDLLKLKLFFWSVAAVMIKRSLESRCCLRMTCETNVPLVGSMAELMH